MNQPKRILIIEDEQDISRILKDYIRLQGYDVHIADNGIDGLRLVETLFPDFIILDIMLPDANGIELCRQIRDKTRIPILILSARGSDTDKVLGLGFGADDYMTKPFSLSELVARIQAHLRRMEGMGNIPGHGDLISLGALTIDKKAYKTTLNGQELALSAKEFELLYFLAEHKNQVFSKSQLLDQIWGYTSHGDESTITVYIRRLREKLEADPSSPSYIKTVWGVGYKFNLD
ncbi:response regulator transcription factor [Paenibacillus riograndensis]|uniref:Transcriptional regulatory protein YycF n=2 Tax=Paenibacillus riograndensis TaxID=483937 RepID=A0A0E3WH72_9BACL|nr:response regulator transcription factor [Paenibacillus riograndensis]KWX84833.1 PhoP family transcriptional regulator [Paenibacillus riograndensis]CQR54783.1 Transcriptional regulatory protein YycF [Paenibacillus riograndensis SBR5]